MTLAYLSYPLLVLLSFLYCTHSSYAVDSSNEQYLAHHSAIANRAIKQGSYDAHSRLAFSNSVNSLLPQSYGFGPDVSVSPYGGYAGYSGGGYYRGPVDSVGAQAARSAASASQNAAALLTIKQNNHDLLYGPQQVLAVENTVDAATNAIFYGHPYASPYGTGSGIASNLYSAGYGSGFVPSRGSYGAALNGAADLNAGLYDYVDGNSYIGTSARIYDEFLNTHAQFTQALSNAAASQRVSHEAAYAASALPPLF